MIGDGTAFNWDLAWLVVIYILHLTRRTISVVSS